MQWQQKVFCSIADLILHLSTPISALKPVIASVPYINIHSAITKALSKTVCVCESPLSPKSIWVLMRMDVWLLWRPEQLLMEYQETAVKIGPKLWSYRETQCNCLQQLWSTIDWCLIGYADARMKNLVSNCYTTSIKNPHKKLSLILTLNYSSTDLRPHMNTMFVFA